MVVFSRKEARLVRRRRESYGKQCSLLASENDDGHDGVGCEVSRIPPSSRLRGMRRETLHECGEAVIIMPLMTAFSLCFWGDDRRKRFAHSISLSTHPNTNSGSPTRSHRHFCFTFATVVYSRKIPSTIDPGASIPPARSEKIAGR